jgi:hypothetical protein
MNNPLHSVLSFEYSQLHILLRLNADRFGKVQGHVELIDWFGNRAHSTAYAGINRHDVFLFPEMNNKINIGAARDGESNPRGFKKSI